MAARIAISDPLPAFRRGLLAILRDAGFDADAPGDLSAWIHDDQPKLVLLTVDTPQDWTLLENMPSERADVLVVALLADTSVPTYVRALTAGAVCAVPRDATLETLRHTFEAVLRGESVLPVPVVRALLTQTDPLSGREPSRRERQWLRDLAQGSTVSQLAAGAGYSERMMFRHLRDLYDRIGAATKVEAVLIAQENGWL